MDRLVKRVVMTVLGLAVTLIWWSIRGSDSNVQNADRIPATVWGGGGGTLTIEVRSTCAARLHVSFHTNQEDQEMMETWEDLEAGTRTWTIDVPGGVGGCVELGAVEPKQGDTLAWQISTNGKVVDEQFDELKEPLEKGYAFFIQSFFEDYSTGEFAAD